jgi:hypothetical protein
MLFALFTEMSFGTRILAAVGTKLSDRTCVSFAFVTVPTLGTWISFAVLAI